MSELFDVDTLLKYNGADILGFVLTFVSLLLLGSKKRVGFLVGALSTIAWSWFSVQAESPPTTLANIVFLVMNLRGWWKWQGPAPATG